jgi:hypothetical protein
LGRSILEDPAKFHRIYFQNIDGIRNDSDDLDLYISSMHNSTLVPSAGQIPDLIFLNFLSNEM